MKELSLVMPFYNEELIAANIIETTISELKQSKIEFELICVNNGSSDNTELILADLQKRHKEIKILKINKNQGYGWGIITGLNAATGSYIGYTDGDGQVAVKDIVGVLDSLKERNYDICKGKRVIRGDGLQRKIASFGYNFGFNVLFSTNFGDINAKPKIMKRECLRKMNLQSKDWFIDSEILIKAKKLNYKVGEVKVEFSGRKTGKSNIKSTTAFEFIKNALKAKLK